MAVDVYPSNVLAVGGGAGGIGGSTFFADNFNRANIGSNWVLPSYFALPQTSPYGGGAYDDTGTVMRCQGNAVNNPAGFWINSAIALPCSVATLAKTHFVQATYASQFGAAAANNPGMIAGINWTDPTTLTCYALSLNPATLLCSSARFISNGQTGIGGAVAFAIGDVLRLSVDYSLAPVSITLRVSRNGVLQDTFVDNSGSRILSGFAGGFWAVCVQTGGVIAGHTWDDFSCGLGL